MNDPRQTPANERVAHDRLKGHVNGVFFTQGIWHRIAVGCADILRKPNGPRDRQALYGARVLVLENHEGFAFIQAQKDGYVGYIKTEHLGVDALATHWVSTLGTHLYPAPDFKQKQSHSLSFGATLTLKGAEDGGASHDTGFAQLDTGYFVPKAHLLPLCARRKDCVASAQMFLGTPYLWGGNSRDGIDCSGLIQAALLGAGHTCPGDSDQQETLGDHIPEGAPLIPSDLLFWKGHVAMVVDQKRIIHANAHHMAVAFEDLQHATARILNQGDGPITARRRLRPLPA